MDTCAPNTKVTDGKTSSANFISEVIQARASLESALLRANAMLTGGQVPCLEGTNLSPLSQLESGFSSLAIIRVVRDELFQRRRSYDGISASAINTNFKRLIDSVEGVARHETEIGELAFRILENTGVSYKSARQTALALMVTASWECRSLAPQILAETAQAAAFARSLERDGQIRLLLFVCPPVDFYYLATDPTAYLRTSMTRSLLSRQVTRLKPLFDGLKALNVPMGLTAMLGDTDEEDYIWPVVGTPLIDVREFASRRSDLRVAVREFLTTGDKTRGGLRLTKDIVAVDSLSKLPVSQEAQEFFDAVCSNPLIGFTDDDIAEEVLRMRELWRPNGYYDGIPVPDEVQLKEIVARKFASYAKQGLMLLPLRDLVLIQTERPAELRTKMINAGRRHSGKELIPTLSF